MEVASNGGPGADTGMAASIEIDCQVILIHQDASWCLTRQSFAPLDVLKGVEYGQAEK